MQKSECSYSKVSDDTDNADDKMDTDHSKHKADNHLDIVKTTTQDRGNNNNHDMDTLTCKVTRADGDTVSQVSTAATQTEDAPAAVWTLGMSPGCSPRGYY